MSEEKNNVSDNSELNENNEKDIVEESADTLYFGDETTEADAQAPFLGDDGNGGKKPEKKKKRITVKAFVLSLIAVAVVAAMLTYAICSSVYQTLYAKVYADAHQQIASSTGVTELDVIAKIINEQYYGEVDSEELMNAAIRAYVAQTGDVYAAYYTQEELEAQLSEDTGNMVGIGVNIINSKVTYQGVEISVLKIINVIKDSPAEQSGVKVGDLIYAAILDGETKTVNELGYDDALNKLLGEVDTTASFIVLRDTGKDALEQITFNIVRQKVVTQSVYWRIPDIAENADKKIGVVKITNFDYTTPTQFTKAVDALKEAGVEKFIFDVRHNPGGYQSSVGAVLSYFLNEGDVYIRTKDNAGNIEEDVIRVVSDFTGDYAGCNVTKEDIGKYKDLDAVVLCNEYTASAGELFVASFKDYNLGKVVGMKTFGKGKLQSTFYLQNYALINYGINTIGNIDGAVKLTTHEYFSAKSDSYDGIGIKPDENVALSEEAMKQNVYDYANLDKIDDQLKKAINILTIKE
ncbi:MAG: hypothetical protein J6U68_03585 [Clostridia bacterium]|nr:hypothetical protein [Clostridia bacterium]